ncbi:MAG: CoA transferase [Candidatus Bathyarchaeia archaeon]
MKKGRNFSPEKIGEKHEALEGIRVIDMTHVIYGPATAMLLAQFGAEVIKVEQLHIGDEFRGATFWGKYIRHASPFYLYLNQNKYFISIDVKTPEGKEIIYKLAKISDVFIENFAPGTTHAWGIGYTQLSKINPRIIYLSESTYGQYGPLRFYPGFDLLAQAASGVAAITGIPGTDKYFKLPDYLGDFLPAWTGFISILAAIYYREKTGRGQYIDLSQCDVLMRAIPHYTYFSITGNELERSRHDPCMVPSGIFKTRDEKFVAICAPTNKEFKAICRAIGREDLLKNERFNNVFERLKPENAQVINEIVEKWVSSLTLDEVIELAEKYCFSAAQVMDEVQIANDPWRWKRGSIIAIDDAMYGKLIMPGPAFQMSETPGRTKWAARPVGYHNKYVLMELLGLSEEEVKELESKGVIGYWDERPGLVPPSYYDIANDPIFNYRKRRE